MNKILRDTLKASMVALAMLGGVMATQAEQASALSLNFKPAGRSLDADPIKDVGTLVGSTIQFDLSLSTFGVADDDQVDEIDYGFGWDSSELQLVGSPNILNGTATSTTTPDFITLTQLLNTAIPQDVNAPIASVVFKVLGGLNNDGDADFATFFGQAYWDGSPLVNLTAFQYQEVEVQHVPSPALIPGVAALGLGLIRKRRAAKSSV
jgi:hypothetical protein